MRAVVNQGGKLPEEVLATGKTAEAAAATAEAAAKAVAAAAAETPKFNLDQFGERFGYRVLAKGDGLSHAATRDFLYDQQVRS